MTIEDKLNWIIKTLPAPDTWATTSANVKLTWLTISKQWIEDLVNLVKEEQKWK